MSIVYLGWSTLLAWSTNIITTFWLIQFIAWAPTCPQWQESEVAQSCLTFCNPVDCSLPGSSIHGIFQVRILEWVTISFSRRSSWPRVWTWVYRIVGRCFTIWATREVSSDSDRRSPYFPKPPPITLLGQEYYWISAKKISPAIGNQEERKREAWPVH